MSAPDGHSLPQANEGSTPVDWPPEPARARAPEAIHPNYRLIRQIGVGGMGVVYEAEQLRPVRRTVAVKLIKLGVDTPQVVARFQAERQALAVLEHPGIARVYDAGVTDLGRPFFVMELVAGRAITEYCDQKRLSVRQRLELFEQVCHAVQHAHFKGVLHRDLKPSNILVTEIDGRAQVKTIDFGIAKSMQTDDELPFATRVGQFVGTPAYTSPEQARGQDVDTRTDVYSLGVVLYELLCGALPLEPGDDKSAHSARRWMDSDPPRPSVRFSGLGQTATDLAERRGIDVAALRRVLRGDLDRIVLKAIDRDRDQRYGTALALAEDVRRHLADEPILARPPTLAYHARKFARRNRVLVLATALAGAALLFGAAAAAVGLIRARNALAREAAALTAEKNQRAAAEQVGRFLSDMLESVDPKKAQGKSVLVRDVLDQASIDLDGRFASQPLVAASLHDTLAETYHGLGDFDQAVKHARTSLELLRRERGENDPATLEAMRLLGKSLRAARQYTEAEALLRDLVERCRNTPGVDELTLCNAEEALGVVLLNLKRPREAEPLIRRSVEVSERVRGPIDGQTLSALHNLGSVQTALGDLRGAEATYRRVLTGRQEVLGSDHPWSILTLRNLGTSLLQQRRPAEAEPVLREVLARSERVEGPDHESTRDALYALATTVRQLDRKVEAIELARELVTRCRRSLPSAHPELLKAVASLALLLEHNEQFDDALACYAEVYAHLPAAEVEPRYSALYSKSYALLLVKQGRLVEAEEPLLAARQRLIDAGMGAGANMRQVLLSLADIAEAAGRREEAGGYRQAAATIPAGKAASTQAGS